MTTAKGRLALIPICLTALLLMTGTASGQSINLTEMVVNNVHGELWLRFGIRVDNHEGIAEVLKDGGDVELQATAKVFRRRALWKDKAVAEALFVTHLDMNPLTQ
jgi:hypothetical protein